MRFSRFIAVLLVGFVGYYVLTHNAQQSRNVVVSASGSVKVSPDSVLINASVSNVALDNSTALATANKSADAMRAALKANKVEDKYLKSQNLMVNPEYKYSNSGSQLIGYRATQSFEITIRDANNSGTVIDAITKAVGNSLVINQVSSFIYDPVAAQASAREIAMKNAKAKAESYAKLSGAKLGKVQFINEEPLQLQSVPMAVGTAKAGAESTQIDLGEQTIIVNLSVTWFLR
jgi:uncharacterized protein YggE